MINGRTANRIQRILKLVAFVLANLALVLAVGILAGYFRIFSNPVSSNQGHKTCTSPPTRREWRDLMPEEKWDYIEAVQCLHNTSSELTGQGSLYDDFVFVHMWVGQECTQLYPGSINRRTDILNSTQSSFVLAVASSLSPRVRVDTEKQMRLQRTPTVSIYFSKPVRRHFSSLTADTGRGIETTKISRIPASGTLQMVLVWTEKEMAISQLRMDVV